MNDGGKLVSVIIPVYNAEPYIKRCLDSVLAQDYQNLQIIVVDDGSIDESGKICDYYAQIDPRIEVYHTINGGSVISRKKGIDRAKGVYVGFVDADDYIEPNMFSVLENVMEKTDADFVHSGYKEVNGKSIISDINFPSEVFTFNKIGERERFLVDYYLNIRSGRTLSYSIWSKLFKRELISKCFKELYDGQQLGEDALCLLRCIMESRRICLLPRAMYNYNVRQNSLSHCDREMLTQDQVMFCAEVLRVMKQYGYNRIFKREIYQFMQSSILPFFKYNTDGLPLVHQFHITSIDYLKGKKIIIYGAGTVGQDIYLQLQRERDISIVCLADREKGKLQISGTKIINQAEIHGMSYDLILIAVQKQEVMEEICKELVACGIEKDRLIWARPERNF